MLKHWFAILSAIVVMSAMPYATNAKALLPYGIGYNLVVSTDTLLLMAERPMHWSEGVACTSDSIRVVTDGLLVVADVAIIPEDHQDSVWVKVAHNQWTMGWLHRSELLQGSRPDNPLSAFIYAFRHNHTTWTAYAYILALLIIAMSVVRERRNNIIVHMPFHHDIPSIYPSLLILATLIMSMYSTYIYTHFQQQWSTFYYYPTLNPFTLPHPMRGFMIGAWLMPVLTMAAIDDVRRELSLTAVVIYICVLIGLCALLFEICIMLSQTIFAWLFCIGVIVALIHHSLAIIRNSSFICGKCKHRLRHKGKCPYCGTNNI